MILFRIDFIRQRSLHENIKKNTLNDGKLFGKAYNLSFQYFMLHKLLCTQCYVHSLSLSLYYLARPVLARIIYSLSTKSILNFLFFFLDIFYFIFFDGALHSEQYMFRSSIVIRENSKETFETFECMKFNFNFQVCISMCSKHCSFLRRNVDHR